MLLGCKIKENVTLSAQKLYMIIAVKRDKALGITTSRAIFDENGNEYKLYASRRH